jgi:5-formyltetrahydrofolate cyclo-ligase
MSKVEIREQKARLRERIWKRIEDEGVGRFPGTRGRIPNFVGAEKAAARLEELDVWRAARRIKANPDSPQAPARKRALESGKIVYMAVPRLRERKCFIELDPEQLDDLKSASTIKGASKLGRPVTISEMKTVDLVLCGTVAATRDGLRVGKGGGYSDLEFGLLMEAGKISSKTPVVTTIHSVQIVSEVPTLAHDFRLHYLVTPEGIVDCGRPGSQPRGILWDSLDEEKREEIPVLIALAQRRTKKK